MTTETRPALTTRKHSAAMETAVVSLAKAAIDLEHAVEDGEAIESYHASLAVALKAYTKLAGPL